MNKIVGFLAVGTAVLVVIIMATLLPEVTVGHEPPRLEACTQGEEGCRTIDSPIPGLRPSVSTRYYSEPRTIPIPWLVVSVLALAVGFWRVGWFVRWLERRGREERAGPDDTSD